MVWVGTAIGFDWMQSSFYETDCSPWVAECSQVPQHTKSTKSNPIKITKKSFKWVGESYKNRTHHIGEWREMPKLANSSQVWTNVLSVLWMIWVSEKMYVFKTKCKHWLNIFHFESLKPQNSKCIWPLPDVLSRPQQSNQTNIEKQKKIGFDMFCMQSREMAHKKAIFAKNTLLGQLPKETHYRRRPI